MNVSSVSRPETAASEVAAGDSLVSPVGKRKAEDALLSTLPRPQAFLFVNPTSGGNAAGCWIDKGTSDEVHEVEDMYGRMVKIQCADIRTGESGNKPLFLKLKKLVDDMKREQINEMVTVVMCGGDGTVLWGLSEIWAHDIDDTYIVIGVIPYGTGNDFAKALNWNAVNFHDPFGADSHALKTLLTNWNDSKVIVHDIWDLEITLRTNEEASGGAEANLKDMKPTNGQAAAAAVKEFGGACFMQIDSSTRAKRILCDSEGHPLTVLKKKLNNYFSLGVESRIGIGFDRHRKQSAFRNKIVYMHEGVKKTLFHKPVVVSRLIRNMKTTDPATGRTQTVFSSDKNNVTQRRLRRCASLIAINIPSFASGLDLWKNAHRIGLQDPHMRNAAQSDLAVLSNAVQQMGDGKLEWVSFGTITSLGTEQVLEGLGRRIHQGGGPFVINFHEDLDTDNRVYFQIDGEFFIMLKPAEMVLRHYRKISCMANGCIRSGNIVEASLIDAHYRNSSSEGSSVSQ